MTITITCICIQLYFLEKPKKMNIPNQLLFVSLSGLSYLPWSLEREHEQHLYQLFYIINDVCSQAFGSRMAMFRVNLFTMPKGKKQTGKMRNEFNVTSPGRIDLRSQTQARNSTTAETCLIFYLLKFPASCQNLTIPLPALASKRQMVSLVCSLLH